ncbi:MAG: hypothetical protein FJ313_00245 [Gemmatimonadetes bacterium]|nr:hypothetical protein [Gemmatimonadota bacterium]
MGRLLGCAVLAVVVASVVGCGGGGGGGPIPPPPPLPGGEIDLGPAVAAPVAAQPKAGAANYITRLEGLSKKGTRPDTLEELRTELAYWVNAVQTDADDSATQLGLSTLIISCASQNASHALGQDIFEGTSIVALADAAVREQLGGTRAISSALGMVVSAGPPPVVDGVSGLTDRPAALAPGQIVSYQQAVRDHLLEPMANAQHRLLAIAESAPNSTRLLYLRIGGTGYALYPADFRALAASLSGLRCLLLEAIAINPDYGNFQWDVSLEGRDANQDGKLTVAEYAPRRPFGNLNATDWTLAGTCLRGGVGHLIEALDSRSHDPKALLSRALADADPGSVRTGLADLRRALAGQVNVKVTYVPVYGDGDGAGCTPVELTVPMNLREIWDNPPASCLDLLPPLYLFPVRGKYDVGGSAVALRLVEVGPEKATYKVVIDGAWGNAARAAVVLGPAPHHVAGDQPTGIASFDLSFNWNWSECQGQLVGQPVTGTATETKLAALVKWDDIPDPTLSGVFPDPDAIKTLLFTQFDRLIIEYGSQRFKDAL